MPRWDERTRLGGRRLRESGDASVCEKDAPSGKKTGWEISSENAESMAGLRFLPLGRMAQLTQKDYVVHRRRYASLSWKQTVGHVLFQGAHWGLDLADSWRLPVGGDAASRVRCEISWRQARGMQLSVGAVARCVGGGHVSFMIVAVVGRSLRVHRAWRCYALRWCRRACVGSSQRGV